MTCIVISWHYSVFSSANVFCEFHSSLNTHTYYCFITSSRQEFVGAKKNVKGKKRQLVSTERTLDLRALPCG